MYWRTYVPYMFVCEKSEWRKLFKRLYGYEFEDPFATLYGLQILRRNIHWFQYEGHFLHSTSLSSSIIKIKLFFLEI